MTTAQESPNGHHVVPPPCSVQNPPELNRADLPTGKANNIPNPSYVHIDTNQLPDRCQFTFSDGRQCTMARSDIHPSLCRFHSEREDQLFGDPSPGGYVVGRALDLPELYSACRDLTTAAGVNRALAQVFRLLAQRRISRQEAATFGHLAQLLLRSIAMARAEHPVVERQKDVGITPLLAHEKVERQKSVSSRESPAANVYLSAGESHGHQELSPVHKAELRGVDKDHQELSPDNKVAAFENGARADSRLTPRREANAAPASCPEADDAASIVIPSLPSADERVAVPGVSYDQRVQTVASNSRKMNTCAKPVSNPSKMNTYEIAELKVAHNEHLRKTGEVANAQVPSAGVPSVRRLCACWGGGRDETN